MSYRTCRQTPVVQRHPQKPQGGTWGVPAGKVDGDEHRIDALYREIQEETGIDLNQEKVDFVTTCYVRYDTYDFLYHIYRSVVGTPR